MKRFSNLQRMAAAVACLGMSLPTAAFAASPAAGRVADISLREGGVLVGQVVTTEGVARPAIPVSVQRGGVEVTRTSTDTQGTFLARGLRGGVYTLVTLDGAATYRVWSHGTAPPAAHHAALLIAGNDLVRGQLPGPVGMGFLSNPWVLAAVVATAIAVPIAVADNNDAS